MKLLKYFTFLRVGVRDERLKESDTQQMCVRPFRQNSRADVCEIFTSEHPASLTRATAVWFLKRVKTKRNGGELANDMQFTDQKLGVKWL